MLSNAEQRLNIEWSAVTSSGHEKTTGALSHRRLHLQLFRLPTAVILIKWKPSGLRGDNRDVVKLSRLSSYWEPTDAVTICRPGSSKNPYTEAIMPNRLFKEKTFRKVIKIK